MSEEKQKIQEFREKYNIVGNRILKLGIYPFIQGLITERIPEQYVHWVFESKDLESLLIQSIEEASTQAREEVLKEFRKKLLKTIPVGGVDVEDKLEYGFAEFRLEVIDKILSSLSQLKDKEENLPDIHPNACECSHCQPDKEECTYISGAITKKDCHCHCRNHGYIKCIHGDFTNTFCSHCQPEELPQSAKIQEATDRVTKRELDKEECKHCGGKLSIRNPKGYCDHLYYPENCEVCQKGESK